MTDTSAASAGDRHASSPDALIKGILRSVKTIAMVGASPNWNRPSYFAMKYLQDKGYRVIPVNPGAVGQEILGVEGGENFVGRGDRGAGLTHHDAGRDIGQACRVGQRHTRGQRRGQHGHDRIARARNVEHLARLGGQMRDLAPAREQRHAVGAARHQKGLERAFGDQFSGRRADLLGATSSFVTG